MEMGAGVVAAVTLVPCACGCGRVVLPMRAYRFATEACRARGDQMGDRCKRQKTIADGPFKCCTRCREAGRVKARRCRQTQRPVHAPTSSIEAVFAAAKAEARRRWHIDPWAQRATWADRWGA